MKSEKEKLSYCLGANIAQSFKSQGISDIDIEIFMEALSDVLVHDDPKIAPPEIENFLKQYFGKIQEESARKAMVIGEEFLKNNSEREEVTVTESGLQYEVIHSGDGEIPKLTDKVTTHYHGTLISGEVFDSSVERGEPATFPLNNVIPGWIEALQMMPVGSKWKLFVPSTLAYGDRGAGPMIGPHSTLIFEVELLGIV